MIKDDIKNIKKFYSIDNAIKSMDIAKGKIIAQNDSFLVDSKNTKLFFVEKGEALFATSWRDNPNNREVIAVMKAKESNLIIYLPGEPFIVKFDNLAIVKELYSDVL